MTWRLILTILIIWLIHHEANENELSYQIIDLGPNSPNISPHSTRGMVIDAGSGGSRLHVYQWNERIFDTVPPPLTFPTSNERWTGRMKPAIATFISDLDSIQYHLSPLIDFAKSVLAGLESDFKSFPIYFKATGGMRELSQSSREKILNRVRILLSDKKFNPFYFRNDFARVISGEEEAIYSWCATNLMMGTLIPTSAASNRTYGTLDLGGSSTQIAFFAPDQDILEGLFRFQIGSQKHWNVYTKSFLRFGINSARARYLTSIADNYLTVYPNQDIAVVPNTLSYCFHAGYSERVLTSNDGPAVEIRGPAVPAGDQLERCMASLRPLLYQSKSPQSYCNAVYQSQCSMADSYQPPLPLGDHDHFIGTSSYTYPWKFLLLPATASLELVRSKAQMICSLNFGELLTYYEVNNLSLLKEKVTDLVPYFCFLSAYTLVLLVDGYGFRMNSSLTVLDEVNGNKVTWALGSILYEINSLPWGLQQKKIPIQWQYIVFASLAGLIVGLIVAYVVTIEYHYIFPDHSPLSSNIRYFYSSYSHDDESLMSESHSGDDIDASSRPHFRSPTDSHKTSRDSLASIGSLNSTVTVSHSGQELLDDKSWIKKIAQFNPFHRLRSNSSNSNGSQHSNQSGFNYQSGEYTHYNTGYNDDSSGNNSQVSNEISSISNGDANGLTIRNVYNNGYISNNTKSKSSNGGMSMYHDSSKYGSHNSTASSAHSTSSASTVDNNRNNLYTTSVVKPQDLLTASTLTELTAFNTTSNAKTKK